MFSNIPTFLSQLQRAKEKGAGAAYLVDDQYLHSLRALV
jgi:hypothetical protein